MDPKELEIFQKCADVWWSHEVLPLRSMNGIRIPYILERLKLMGVIGAEVTEDGCPLKGISILDVGCGGGFVCEPLAELGAEVTGIDGCPELIEVAKKHLVQEGKTLPNLTYFADAVEDFAEKSSKQYDVVLALEIMDHVNDKLEVIKAMMKCLKPGGSIFLSTISRTFLSWIFCKILPEYVCNCVTKGTHTYAKFITPEEMEKMLESHDCITKEVKGMYYNYFWSYWFWLRTTSTWYIMHAVKNT